MTDVVNDNLLLISGESTTGKSAALRNLAPQQGVMYLNCEAGKKLPFRNKFETYVITDPWDVYGAFDHAEERDDIHTIVVDTLTFLMDMYESVFVLTSSNTMGAWSDYQQFFKNLMQDKVANSTKNVIFLAHTRAEFDEVLGDYRTQVPVKGALKNNGIEAYFSTVVSTKRVKVKDLEGQDDDMLTITEEEEALGFKHVFQTRLTKETKNERIRSPMGMFGANQTYIDNDAALLMAHLKEYYDD